jgi:hypothetical protein
MLLKKLAPECAQTAEIVEPDLLKPKPFYDSVENFT